MLFFARYWDDRSSRNLHGFKVQMFLNAFFHCSCQDSTIQLDSDSDQEPTAVPKVSNSVAKAPHTAVKSAPPPAPVGSLSPEDWKRKYEELLATVQQQAPATPRAGVFTPVDKKQVFTPTPTPKSLPGPPAPVTPLAAVTPKPEGCAKSKPASPARTEPVSEVARESELEEAYNLDHKDFSCPSMLTATFCYLVQFQCENWIGPFSVPMQFLFSQELTQHALYMRGKRLCTRTNSGALAVSEEVAQQWAEGNREELLLALTRALKVHGFCDNTSTRKLVRVRVQVFGELCAIFCTCSSKCCLLERLNFATRCSSWKSSEKKKMRWWKAAGIRKKEWPPTWSILWISALLKCLLSLLWRCWLGFETKFSWPCIAGSWQPQETRGKGEIVLPSLQKCACEDRVQPKGVRSLLQLIWYMFSFCRKYRYDPEVPEFFVQTADTVKIRRSELEKHQKLEALEGENLQRPDKQELMALPTDAVAPVKEAPETLSPDDLKSNLDSFVDSLHQKATLVTTWLAAVDVTISDRAKKSLRLI